MAQELDSLSIKISADAGRAVRAIDALISSISGLSTAVSDVDVSNIANLTKVLTKTSKSLSEISSHKDAVKTLKDIGKALETISKSSGNVDAFVKAMGNVQGASDSTQKSVKDLSSSISNSFQPPAVIKTMTTELATLSNEVKEVVNELTVFENESTGLSVNVDATSLDTFKYKLVELAEYFANIRGLLGDGGVSGLVNGTVATMGNGLDDIPYAEFRELEDELETVYERANETASGFDNFSQSIVNATYDGLRIRELVNQFNELSRPLNSAEGSLSAFKKALVGLKIIIPTKDLESVQKQIDKVRNHYETLKATISQKLSKTDGVVNEKEIEKDIAELQALRNEYDRLIQKQAELSRNGGYKFNFPKVDKTTNSFKSIGKVFDSIISKVKSFASAIGNALSKAIKTVGRFASSLLSIGNNSNKASKGLGKLLNSSNKIFKSFSRIFKMLRLMITRKILQALIKNAINGFNNVVQFSAEMNAQVSLLWNSLRQLGNAFGAMTAPLLNAFAPAINAVIQALINAVNWVNQLFATLTGASTWIKAKTLTDSYADSLDSAKKSADKLKKSVMGFDELNQLQDKNDSSSGTNPKDMFETVEVDDNVKKIGDWLKSMKDLANFYDLGALLGQKFKKWLDAIPWTRIRKTLNKIGKSLATLINGFVEVEGLGRSIGNTLAQALNSIFEFVNGFVHNLKWDSVGKFIAETFNGFFEGIDWELIRDTVITGIKGLATSINSFISTFNWDNVSNTISNFVNTFVEAIKEFFRDVDFGELGKNLGEQLRLTIEKIDWQEAGRAVGAVINSMLEFASGFINEQSFSTIKDSFNAFITGLKEELGIDNFYDVINGLVEGIKKFFEDVDWADLGDRVGGKIKEALQNIDFVTLGQTLATILQGAFNFLKALLTPDFFSEVKQAVFDLLKGFFETIDKEDLAKAIAIVLGAVLVLSFSKALVVKGVGSLGTSILTGIFTSASTTEIAATITTVLASALAGVKIGSIVKDSMLRDWADEYNKKHEGESRIDVDDMMDEYGGIKGTFRMLKDEAEAFFNCIKTGSGIISTAANTTNSYNQALEICESGQARSVEWFNKLKDVYNLSDDQIQKLKETMYNTASQTDSWKDKTQELADAMGYIPEVTNKAKDSVEDIGETTKSTSNTMAQNFVSIRQEELQMARDNKKNTDDIKTNHSALSDSVSAFKSNYANAVDSVNKSSSNMESSTKVVYERVENSVSNSAFAMEGTLNELVKTTDDAKNDIAKSADDIRGNFTEDKWTFQGVIDGLKNTFGDAIKGIKEKWNGFARDFNSDEGSSGFKLHLPTFSTGGFPEDGLFMANHGELVGRFSNGKTAVANNQQIVDGIKQGVYEAVAMAMSTSGGNGGSSSYINNTIQIDGETIARAVTKGQRSIDRRYNPSLT